MSTAMVKVKAKSVPPMVVDGEDVPRVIVSSPASGLEYDVPATRTLSGELRAIERVAGAVYRQRAMLSGALLPRSSKEREELASLRESARLQAREMAYTEHFYGTIPRKRKMFRLKKAYARVCLLAASLRAKAEAPTEATV